MAFRLKLSPGQDARQFHKPLSLRQELSAHPGAPTVSTAVSPWGEALSLRIASVVQEKGCSRIELQRAGTGPLPAFRPGQVISLFLPDREAVYNRSYTLCGTVQEAEQGSYFINVRERGRYAPGLLAEYQVGDLIQAAGPWGDFAYLPDRDGEQILAIAEEGGVLSFLPLLRALTDPSSDCTAELTLVVQARRASDLLYKEELDRLAGLSPYVSIDWWLSDDYAPGCKRGQLARNELADYLQAAPSCLLLSASRAFGHEISSLLNELWPELDLPPRSIQRQPLPYSHQPWTWLNFPPDARDQVYQLTVQQWDRTYTVPAPSGQTLLDSLQEAGIAAPARCRGGECGFCRAKLLSGRVCLPPDEDYRRLADLETGFVHPCCAYPVSDIELLINGDPTREQTSTVPGSTEVE